MKYITELRAHELSLRIMDGEYDNQIEYGFRSRQSLALLELVIALEEKLAWAEERISNLEGAD